MTTSSFWPAPSVVADSPVRSVNGAVGDVVLAAADVGAVATVNGESGPAVSLSAADVGAVATVNGESGPTVSLSAADVGAVVPVGNTFSPVFTFATPGDLSVSYSIQTGIYYRIGNFVFVSVSLAFTPTYSTASGVVEITGLPFAADGNAYAVCVTYSNITFPTGTTDLNVSLADGETKFNIRAQGSGTASVRLSTTQFPTATARTLQFTIGYLTDAA